MLVYHEETANFQNAQDSFCHSMQHFYTVYDTEPSETAVEGPSKPKITNTNEEKDDSETPLKAPTGGFQHKHLMMGMFITIAYEVKGKRGSMYGKVYVGMIDALCPHFVEVIFLRKAGASLCYFRFHANDHDEIGLSRVVKILPVLLLMASLSVTGFHVK
ncbi:hypothetical protein QYM36_000171 [Artemia franciscana]|uniref:Uncharacterized protein n=1 Tax=Artemia franciscana TaxID=6661 RepID=A0AA88LBT1_ARTSF|nr:hypothetical protein QYM36_000171 [Artemia franciscana]